jgi:hypothetical protein
MPYKTTIRNNFIKHISTNTEEVKLLPVSLMSVLQTWEIYIYMQFILLACSRQIFRCVGKIMKSDS